MFLLAVFTLIAIKNEAQGLNDRTLMTINNKDIRAGEFIRMYNKTSDPGSKQDPETYLQQYIIFKQKVEDAIASGIDTTKAFKNELNGYRNQLAQNYLTDNQLKEKLLEETYKRSLTEINAWHILVSCLEGTKPPDTLAAWNKAKEIRDRILLGEPFEQVARATSDDPSVRINGGNLGYFTVFQMITPFEDAAYNLKKGAISDPVRTPYGYHIIKVTDKRPARGKILVAHIMKAFPASAGEAEMKKAGDEINSIYNELQNGAPFSILAKKYSDHKESALKGGKLDWFSTGEIVPEFEEAAFSISDTGKYSKPVKTSYGWHIIKLLDKRPPGSFEETRSYLESKINQSYLNSLSKKSLVDKLKKEYRFNINQDALNWFVNNTDTLIIQGLSKYNRDSVPKGSIYSFANQSLSNKEFATLIERRGSPSNDKDTLQYLDRTIEILSDDQIIKYENSLLEKKYPEFRDLMNEFHDGILLFEISGRKVWNKVQDTSEIKAYYETVKGNYLTKRSIEGKLYTLRSVDGEKKLSQAFNKYAGKPQADEMLLKKFNKKNDSALVILKDKWIAGENELFDPLKCKLGTNFIKTGNYPSILMINKINEPVPLPFKEIQGEILNTYQEYLENEWIKQLKQKYPVKINNDVFAEIKKTL